MSKAVKSIVSGVASAVSDLASSAFSVVSGIAGKIVGGLLDVPDLDSQAQDDQTLSVNSSPKPRMIVGKAVVSGDIIKYHPGTENQTKYHYFFVNLTTHPCKSVSLYQMDGKNNLPLTGNGYYMLPRLGDQVGPPSRAVSKMSNVDSSFVGTNCTDVYCEISRDTEVFPNGMQDLKYLVEGAAFYDPRQDDTVGGAGSHRLHDPNTWEYSDNAALINFYWDKFGGPIELPDELYDLQNIAQEASVCDEVVDYIDESGLTKQEKRFTCNGTIDLESGWEQVQGRLLTSCGGAWIESGAKRLLRTAVYRGPSTITISSRDLAGKPRERPVTPLSSKLNKLTASFISKDDFYQATTCTPVISTFLRNGRDKGVNYEDKIPLPFTNSNTQSQRLCVLHLMRNAAGRVIDLPVKNVGLRCSAGSICNLDLPDLGITGEFEVQQCDYDLQSKIHQLQVQETSPDIYNQLQTPAQSDVTPNVIFDDDVEDIQNIIYTPTPNDSYRQGVLSWSHPVPNSVTKYTVLLFRDPQNWWGKSLHPVSLEQKIEGLPVGKYQAWVRAENRFGKRSEYVVLPFEVENIVTPAAPPTIQVTPGNITVTPVAPPTIEAIYEGLWTTDDNLNPNSDSLSSFNVIPAGKSLVIANAYDGVTYYLWYRLKTSTGNGEWVSRTIVGVGINQEQLDAELLALFQTLLDLELDPEIIGQLNDLALNNLDNNKILEDIQAELEQINIEAIADLAEGGKGAIERTVVKFVAEKGKAKAEEALIAVVTEKEARSAKVLQLETSFSSSISNVNQQIGTVSRDNNANAFAITLLSTDVDAVKANYASKSYADSTAESAAAGNLVTIDARFDQNTGVYGQQIKTAVDAASAATSAATNLAAGIYDSNGNLSQAFIDNVSLVSVQADGQTIAASINTWTVDVGGSPRSISQIANASIDAEGNNFTSQWAVQTDIDGLKHGVGFFLENGVTSFVITTDNVVIRQAGTSNKASLPFVFTNGTLHLDDAKIKQLAVEKLVGQIESAQIKRLTVEKLEGDVTDAEIIDIPDTRIDQSNVWYRLYDFDVTATHGNVTTFIPRIDVRFLGNSGNLTYLISDSINFPDSPTLAAPAGASLRSIIIEPQHQFLAGYSKKISKGQSARFVGWVKGVSGFSASDAAFIGYDWSTPFEVKVIQRGSMIGVNFNAEF